MLGYRFITDATGLRIEHERIEPVVFALEPFSLVVRGPRPIAPAARRAAQVDDPARFALADAHGAARCILERVAERGWRPPALPHSILVGHLLAERARRLGSVNPAAHAVEQAVLAVAIQMPLLAGAPALYEEPFIVKDVLQYRAAACALAFVEQRLFAPWARSRGLPPATSGAPPVPCLIDAMRDWRSLFSPSGRAYRSLNRTLMNLPAELPGELLCHLASHVLEGPILQRLPLTALLLHIADAGTARDPASASAQRRMLARASDGEIAAALESIGEHAGRRLRASRREDLAFAVRYLADYREPFHGRLGGLVHRAIRWHERFRQQPPRRSRAGLHDDPADASGRAPRLGPARAAAARSAARPAPAQARAAYRGAERLTREPRPPLPTARPPIPLPGIAGIEFLDTVERVREEGLRLENCLASYASAALAGRSYLFHVDHEGEQACVEVAPGGHVRQAEGPRNTRNGASVWGARELRAWARALREPVEVQRDEPAAEAAGTLLASSTADMRSSARRDEPEAEATGMLPLGEPAQASGRPAASTPAPLDSNTAPARQ